MSNHILTFPVPDDDLKFPLSDAPAAEFVVSFVDRGPTSVHRSVVASEHPEQAEREAAPPREKIVDGWAFPEDRLTSDLIRQHGIDAVAALRAPGLVADGASADSVLRLLRAQRLVAAEKISLIEAVRCVDCEHAFDGPEGKKLGTNHAGSKLFLPHVDLSRPPS